MGHPVSDETALAKLVSVLGQYFQPRGITRRMTVTNARPAGKAQIVIGTIGEGRTALPGQTFDIGNGDSYANGEVYEIHGTGDPNDPQWRIGRRLVARNPKRGADLYAPLPAPVWSSVVNPDDGFGNPIALYTEADLNATTGANGEPLALVTAIYRTIVPGSYSVFKEHITDVQLQVKALSAEGWRNIPKQHVTPSRPIRISLNEALDESATAVAIALPADVSIDELIPGSYVHWRIDGEIVIAKVVSTVLLTVLAVGGRGAEGTPAASHVSGAEIELLSGMAVAHGMDPGVETQARVAFIDGYGVAGPPSTIQVLTTWYQTSVPQVSSLLVDMRSNGYKLSWGRPLDPDSSLPVTSKLFYRVYRNTSATTVGAKIVRDRDVNLEDDIAATDWDTDATRAQAYWFGVQAYDGFGNASTIVWAMDNVPPPAPSGVTFTSVPNGILVSVDPNVDTAHTDPGFANYRLYTNAAGSGTTGTELTASSSLVFTYEIHTLDSQTFYQITAADWAGNESVLLTGGWRYVASLYPTTDWPQNGNFQDPDAATPQPGVAGSRPRWWTFNGPDLATVLTYEPNGGTDGNRVMKFHYGANLQPTAYIESVPQTLPSHLTPTVECWVYSTAAISLQMYYVFQLYNDDAGAVFNGSWTAAEPSLVATMAIPATTWTRIRHTFPSTVQASAFSTARTGAIDVLPSLALVPTHVAFDLYVDAVRVVWA